MKWMRQEIGFKEWYKDHPTSKHRTEITNDCHDFTCLNHNMMINRVINGWPDLKLTRDRTEYGKLKWSRQLVAYFICWSANTMHWRSWYCCKSVGAAVAAGVVCTSRYSYYSRRSGIEPKNSVTRSVENLRNSAQLYGYYVCVFCCHVNSSVISHVY